MDLTVSVTKTFDSFDLAVDFSITDGKMGFWTIRQRQVDPGKPAGRFAEAGQRGHPA